MRGRSPGVDFQIYNQITKVQYEEARGVVQARVVGREVRLMNSVSSSKVAIDGCELKVLRAGAGTPLLLVHGGEQDAQAYRSVAEELGSGFDVVVYDRRGYAGSPSSHIATGDAFVEQQAHDAGELLGQLGTGPAIVFGTSSGAIIALRLALRCADRVRGLILHEPAWIEPFPVVADAFRQLIASGARPGGGGSDRYKPQNAEYWRRCEVEPILSHRISHTELAAVRAPAVVALGMESGPQMQAIAAWTSWKLGAPLLEFPGGHEPVFEVAPAQFSAAVREACRRLEEMTG